MASRYASAAEVNGASGIAPALSVLPAGLVQTWLTLAQAYVGVTEWGDRASVGHALLTAHFLSLTPEASAAGVGASDGIVSSESNGPASRSFAVPSFSSEDSAFAGTVYGRQWAELRRIVVGGLVGLQARGSISAGWWPSSWGRGPLWSR